MSAGQEPAGAGENDPTGRAFERELALDRIEAGVAPAVAEYLAARWRQRDRADGLSPPWPTVLLDGAMMRQLSRWRAVSRRALMLWRWLARAQVESDPEVCRWLGERRWSALCEARNRAAQRVAGLDYVGLAAELSELEESESSAADTTPEQAPEQLPEQFIDEAGPSLDDGPPVRDVDDLLRHVGAMGLSLDGVHIDFRVGAGPSARGRTFVVDPPRDIRVWVRAPDFERGLPVLAHELGHALYAAGCDPLLPWSLRGAPALCIDEGVAYAFQHVVAAPRPVAAHWVTRERDGYAGRAGSEEWWPWLAREPGVCASYRVGYRLGRLLWAHLRARRLERRGAWLAEALFQHGATRPWRERIGSLGQPK